MKKFSRKRILLFRRCNGGLRVCAATGGFGGQLGVVGSHHTLDSANFGFMSNIGGSAVSSSCTSSSFTARVLSAGDLSISAASFGGLCTHGGPGIGTCTMTTASTGFPWRGTAVTTSNIQIHGIDIDVLFENTQTPNSCPLLTAKS